MFVQALVLLLSALGPCRTRESPDPQHYDRKQLGPPPLAPAVLMEGPRILNSGDIRRNAGRPAGTESATSMEAPLLLLSTVRRVLSGLVGAFIGLNDSMHWSTGSFLMVASSFTSGSTLA